MKERGKIKISSNDNIKYSNYCFVCKDKLIDGNSVIKKFETYGGYAKICHECLDLPVKCIKTSMTLAEMIRRLKFLRK